MYFNKVFLMFYSCSLYAGELCSLQPDDYDGSTKSIRVFEKNVENKMTDIYQKEYPLISESLKMIKALQQAKYKWNQALLRKYVHIEKQDFIDLIDQNLLYQEEFNHQIKKINIKQNLDFGVYRDYAHMTSQLNQSLDDMNEMIRPMREPYFLYVPEIDFSIRGHDTFYGHLKMEMFFRPPKDNLFKLPFLNIGFKTDQNTVIYACIHMDAFDENQNVFYIYFLNTTKLYKLKLTDIFFNTPLIVRHIVTLGKPPSATIAPITFVMNPLRAIKQVDQIFQLTKSVNLSFLTHVGIFNFIGKLNFLDLTANLNPIQKIIVDNIDIGIKGILIRPGTLKIRYAGTTLYGLLTFNLAQQSHNSDFSYFMNAFTIQPQLSEE